MLNAMLAELHDDGIALSTLYPATRSLYRKSGWEPAGGHFKAKAPVASMRLRERDLELRPMTDADREEIISVYRQQAARTSGNLDRGDFQWGRVHRPRGAADVRGFVTGRRGSIEGYVILHEKRVDRGFLDYDLMVTDLVALTPEAGRRLITFFGDHATLGGNVIWGTGPNDPIVQLLPERGYELHLADHWMLRVVDVQAALAERGYPEHLEIELHLEVRDDILAANDGRFILRVAGGRAEVKRGGRGRIQMHVRGLAALYSGHLTPHALESAGLLQATEPELAKAAAVFAGPFPWMPDYF
jgi:predicted acetyltransferase